MVDQSRTISNEIVRQQGARTPSGGVDNFVDVDRKFGADDLASEMATEAEVDAKIAAGGGGGGGTFTLVASGLIPTGTNLGTVFSATAGKEYVIIGSISDEAGPNLVSGDLANYTLRAISGGNVIVDVPANAFQTSARVGSLLSLGGSQVVLNAGAATEPTFDATSVLLNSDGTVTAQHTDNGGGSNGAYLVFER